MEHLLGLVLLLEQFVLHESGHRLLDGRVVDSHLLFSLILQRANATVQRVDDFLDLDALRRDRRLLLLLELLVVLLPSFFDRLDLAGDAEQLRVERLEHLLLDRSYHLLLLVVR